MTFENTPIKETSPKDPKVKRKQNAIKRTNLSFTGDLGIKDAARFVQALQKNIASGKTLKLSLEKISTLELPFIQALIAAGRVLKEKKLPIMGNIELYPGPAELLKRAGLFAELEKQGFTINISNNDQK